MVAVFILVSIFVGLTSATTALVMGSSILGALGWYVAAGTATMIVMPLVVFVTGRLADSAAAVGDEAASWHTGAVLHAETASTADAPVGIDDKMRILAVDDDPFVLELVPKIATNAGFPAVTTASSGAEALAALEAPGAQFDCLLLDIKMPEMDGIELCRRIRAKAAYEDTPIVMLTAMRDLASMSDAYQAGASDYATKPFEVDEMAKRLKHANAINVARQQPRGRTRLRKAKSRGAGGGKSGSGLVTETALASYLSRLSEKQTEDVHVYALSLAGRAPVSLDNLASAAARCIGKGLLLAGRSEDDHLLLVVDAHYRGLPDQIESEIKRQVAVIDAAQSGAPRAEPELALGGPVVPSVSREGRGRMAIDRAIVQATSYQAANGVRKVSGLEWS